MSPHAHNALRRAFQARQGSAVLASGSTRSLSVCRIVFFSSPAPLKVLYERARDAPAQPTPAFALDHRVRIFDALGAARTMRAMRAGALWRPLASDHARSCPRRAHLHRSAVLGAKVRRAALSWATR